VSPAVALARIEMSITPATTVVVSSEQVSCDLAGEAAILSLKNSMYYGLDVVGARIWNLVQEPRTVGGIRDALVQEYDVEPGRCERDVIQLLQRLAAEGLVEIKRDTAA
jgi:Coenzyme PQQ synthesis protein D (PqqD)